MKALSLLLLAVTVVVPPSAHVQNPPAQGVIDLNGVWTDNGRLVDITQTGIDVVAMFKTPPKCDPQDGSTPQPRNKDFKGVIDVRSNMIFGKITVCNYGKEWKGQIGIQEVGVRLSISADRNTLSGEYAGWQGPVPVTITRECKPDPRKLCDAINRAIQRMRGALTAPASASHYGSLQQNISTELNTIRNNVCDKPDGTAEVDKLQQDLDSLSYVPGQSNFQNNLAIGKVETGLKALSNSLCSAFNPPPPPPPCADGSALKTEEDRAFMNSFKTKLEPQLPARILGGLAQTKRCLTEIFGQTCAPQSFINDLRMAAQLRDEGYRPTDICPRMCQTLGDWYEASACREGGFDKSVVVNKCTSVCLNNPNFYPE